MPETVLVTGANGFLGRHLVAELLGRGYRVRALVRAEQPAPTSPLPPLAALPVERHVGDLTSPKPWPAPPMVARPSSTPPPWRR